MPRLLFYCLFLWSHLPVWAQKKQPLLPEAVYVNRLAAALAQPESAPYAALMPPPEVLFDLQPILPRLISALGPDSLEVATNGISKALERQADRSFHRFREESEAMRLRWHQMRLARYELVKQPRTRDSLLEKLIPERYKGYVFFLDPMRQKTFCIQLWGLFTYKGRTYGGALASIYPAETIAAYEAHVAAARKAALKGEKYIAFQPEDTEDEVESEDTLAHEAPLAVQPKGVVAERLYFKGFFDDEIPVQLFVRGYRGDCPEGVCRWNAIMLVGDEDRWVGLTMLKKEGAWLFTEIPNKAVMELRPDAVGLKGSWNATDDNTGYEVELSSKELPKKNLAFLEDMMDEYGL